LQEIKTIKNIYSFI